ncbi:MAG: hypothetical protein IIC76_08065 [Bacteroidetes bacterium]|nr:hypothetical protein [Bacteroidota bacterium]
MVNHKLSIYDIKNLLDHSNIKTTETFYALAMNERIRKEIDKTVRFVK